MSTNFPASLDNGTSLPYPSALSKRNSPSLASLSDNQNDAVIATQTKVGIGASTPTASNFLVGTGAGTSAWTKAVPAGVVVGTTDSQTLTNKILTSPTINSPIITNATITTDLITGFTVSNSGTVFGVPVTTGVIQTANTVSGAALTALSVQTASIANSAVDYTKVATGFAVQSVSTNFSAVATGTGTIPTDDTIPQITEGTEFMTLAITPKSATNILVIQVVFFGSYSIAERVQVALFQDATANALSGTSTYQATAAAEVTVPLQHRMVTGTTSSTTFRVRAGANSPGTMTFNGTAGARRFGGITLSNITITEYKA